METVILCGGKGLRMGNQNLPKPLVKIGDKPILWHIMQIYSSQGFNKFTLCLGYLGEKIVEYFSNENQDNLKEYRDKDITTIHQKNGNTISCINTGEIGRAHV